MKAMLTPGNDFGHDAHGAVVAGEYILTLVPETEEEKAIALGFQRNLFGIKSLPAGEAGTYLYADPVQYMASEIVFHLGVTLKHCRVGVGK